MRRLLVLGLIFATMAAAGISLNAELVDESCELIVSIEPQLITERNLATEWVVDSLFRRV